VDDTAATASGFNALLVITLRIQLYTQAICQLHLMLHGSTEHGEQLRWFCMTHEPTALGHPAAPCARTVVNKFTSEYEPDGGQLTSAKDALLKVLQRASVSGYA
jgi:hypothetical protein